MLLRMSTQLATAPMMAAESSRKGAACMEKGMRRPSAYGECVTPLKTACRWIWRFAMGIGQVKWAVPRVSGLEDLLVENLPQDLACLVAGLAQVLRSNR